MNPFAARNSEPIAVGSASPARHGTGAAGSGIAPALAAVIPLLGLCLTAAPAHAQLARTFVSSATGTDANDCNRLTPCRTFQTAHDKTLANGEITVLDPGGYGAVTIKKAISIINDGVGEAGVLVSGGATGISVKAGPTDSVSLRGLTIKGIGFGGGTGIHFSTGRSLTIENCVVRNLTGLFPDGRGIVLEPSVASSLAVSGTLVADNASDGIFLQPLSSVDVKATFNGAEMYGNGGSGISILGAPTGSMAVVATAIGSVAANNGRVGFAVQSLAGQAPASLMVVRSVAVNNATGISAVGAPATLRFGRSTLTGNAVSWHASSGAVPLSYGDNNIDGNADGDPAPATIAKR
jgi:hypothetical protein